MFEQMMRRVEAGAGEAARLRAAGMAEAYRAVAPEAEVKLVDGVIMVRGPGLTRRWLDDGALRAIGIGR